MKFDVKLITLDAFNTIIHPRHSVPEQYANIISRHLGRPVAKDDIARHFPAVFKSTQLEYPNYGKGMVNKLNDNYGPRLWWDLLISRLLARIGIVPEGDEDQLSLLQQDLWDQFGTRRGYEVYPDTRAGLQELQRISRLGVISNSDDRIVNVLKDLSLSSFIDPSLVWTSFHLSCQKPSSEIFRECWRQAKVRPEQTLHIGDDYNEDFMAALNAGGRALWLDRGTSPSSSVQPPISSDYGARITNLSEAVEWIK